MSKWFGAVGWMASLQVDTFVFLRCVLWTAGFLATSVAQTAPPKTNLALPSETPAEFKTATASFDYDRRDVMIPMRDGVRLHTVILVPKGAKGAPILLTRTPYDANELTGHAHSSHLSYTATTTPPM